MGFRLVRLHCTVRGANLSLGYPCTLKSYNGIKDIQWSVDLLNSSELSKSIRRTTHFELLFETPLTARSTIFVCAG